MGTRADFYVGRGPQADWLGSIAWDGNPGAVDVEDSDGGRAVIRASSEAAFRVAVAAFLARRDDATTPAQGWPWPWKDSCGTDYAYAWDDGALWACSTGYTWFQVDPGAQNYGEPAESTYEVQTATFPDMTARRDVTLGDRSGLLIVRKRDGGA
jgi:hypothetical protein